MLKMNKKLLKCFSSTINLIMSHNWLLSCLMAKQLKYSAGNWPRLFIKFEFWKVSCLSNVLVTFLMTQPWWATFVFRQQSNGQKISSFIALNLMKGSWETLMECFSRDFRAFFFYFNLLLPFIQSSIPTFYNVAKINVIPSAWKFSMQRRSGDFYKIQFLLKENELKRHQRCLLMDEIIFFFHSVGRKFAKCCFNN